MHPLENQRHVFPRAEKLIALPGNLVIGRERQRPVLPVAVAVFLKINEVERLERIASGG
jgi:hypothetical protein